MKLIRIVDWNKRFENNRSRTIQSLDWVPVPNNHDGEGYCLVMAHARAPEIYSAWHLMLQVASRCHPRGSLVRSNGRPHTPESLSLKTRAKASWFEIAIEVLASRDVAWIEVVEVPDIQGEASQRQPSVSQTSTDCQQSDAQVTKKEGRKEGIEGKGIEGREGTSAAALFAPELPSRFQKPCLEAVRLQAVKIGLPESEAVKFFNYYESNGWRVGRNPMKSWHHAIQNWKIKFDTDRNANRSTSNRPGPNRNAGTFNEGRASDYDGIGQL
jgi:hypothetical protein